jgi:hypothetical protein
MNIDLRQVFKDSPFDHIVVEINNSRNHGSMMNSRTAIVSAMADQGYTCVSVSVHDTMVQLGFLTNADAETYRESIVASCRNSLGGSTVPEDPDRMTTSQHTQYLLELMGKDHVDLEDVPMGLFFENLEHLLTYPQPVLLDTLAAKTAWFYRVLEAIEDKPQWQVRAKEGLAKIEEIIGANRLESFRNSALYKATKPFGKFDWATLRSRVIAPRSIAEYMEQQDRPPSPTAVKRNEDDDEDIHYRLRRAAEEE